VRDKKLEQQIVDFGYFIEDWKEFHELMKTARETEEIPETDEKRFFELKRSILKRYNVLMKSVGLEGGQEAKGMDVLSQIVNLKELKAQTDGMARRMITIWNEHYIMLERVLGELEHNRAELAKISRLWLFLKKIIWNPLTVVIYMIIVLLSAYIAYNWIMQKYSF
jgi:hypothetical protein